MDEANPIRDLTAVVEALAEAARDRRRLAFILSLPERFRNEASHKAFPLPEGFEPSPMPCCVAALYGKVPCGCAKAARRSGVERQNDTAKS